MARTNCEQSLKIAKPRAGSAENGRLPVNSAFIPGIGFREWAVGGLLSALIALLLLFPAPASAHPPADIKVSYLEAEQSLQVTITHRSVSPNYHYIKTVKIQKNSEIPMVKEYSSQPDKTAFSYTYKLPLQKGDRVSVKASCSLYGSKTAEMGLGEPAGK